MDLSYIIKKPLVTEKGTYGMNELNRYAFEVDVRAKKPEIKAAVETLYNVRVVAVNTQIRKARTRRMRYGVVPGKVTKKALVRLHPEDTIELF